MKGEMMKIGVMGAGALALFAGCTILPSVGPSYERPEFEIVEFELPDAGMPTTNRTASGEWQPAAGAEDVRAVITTNAICQWWTRFDDAQLTSLVERAVAGNLSFAMAQQRVEAARWTLFGSGAAFMPQVTGVAGFSRFEKWPNTQSMVGTGRRLHRDLFTGGFDATWEIDIFGGSRRAMEAAGAEYDAAEWGLADAWVMLTAEVGREYIQLRTTQQRIAVARTNLVLQRETYDILKSRLDSGIGDELAVNQSKYIADQTLATIPPLLAQEEELLNAIAILTGELPGAHHEELKDCPDRDWLIEPQKIAAVPLNQLRNRPDVRVAERQLAAQVARIGVAKSMWYPKLFINGSLGLESVKMADFLKKDSFYGAIGPSISWPIFQGGNVSARVKVEEARMEEARLKYAAALQNAYRDVRDAYARYTQQYHRYQALQGAVKAAQDAVAISKDLYKNGLRDFTAVIDAQRSLLALEEALVISRGQITLELLSLYKALGGGLV